MRITGFVLLAFGIFLCATIVWAALGFLMMALGLLCLLIAENKKKGIVESKTFQSESAATKQQTAGVDDQMTIVGQRGAPADSSEYRFDAEEWNRLIKTDPDIASLVEVLSNYDEKYVERFAKAYLEHCDKRYLPAILDQIIESATAEYHLQEHQGRSEANKSDATIANPPVRSESAPRVQAGIK